jgi:hypothetical protein
MLGAVWQFGSLHIERAGLPLIDCGENRLLASIVVARA